jgi:LysR family transcriptional regulator, regulator for bpeEF and oprC
MLDIDLNRLAIFKVVVLTGSFSKAGIQLKMPKSKVSRQIAALESELKVPLIYRTTRSLQLTEAGRELYQKALPHLLDLEAALQNIGDDRLDAQGALKFTVPEDIGVEIMGGLCHEFQQLYPRIRLEMIIDNRPLDLVSEGVDLALRIGRIKDSSLTIRKVGQVKLGFFAGLSLFQKQNRPTKVEDLLSIPYLSFFGSEKQVIKLKGPKDSVSLKLNPSFTSNNLFVLKKMAPSRKWVYHSSELPRTKRCGTWRTRTPF